jgi:biopolymer transport protein ExbD
MAGSSYSDDDEVISQINITPLVDVVLVLLVIFLITAPVIYQSAIKVKLPQASSGETAEKSPFEFTLTKDGVIHWDSESLTVEQVSVKLKAMGDLAQDQTAIISADEATAHGIVVKLMDVLRQTGLTKFALNVDK